MMSRRFIIPLVLLLAALLLSSGPAQGPVAAQGETAQAPEPPPAHLPYDGLLDLPRLSSAAATVAPDAPQAALAPEYAAWSRLVFQSARNGNDWEVFVAAGDGSGQANISNLSSMEIHPRLNRGATRVAFASKGRSNYDIFTINADGGGQARLTNNDTDDVYPAWSPDGSRIAFQAYRNGQAEIYVMNADGSGQARLTNYSDYDGEPTWSPDGAQIAFTRKSSGQYRIWAMNADGSNPHQLSNQASSENAAWSPDGSRIAYDADGNGDGWQEIWLMDAAGGNQRQAYDPPASYTDAWVRSWSPDGRYVAFTRISFTYYQNNWYWTTAYLDAADMQNPGNTIRLSSNGEDWNPDWQPTDIQAPVSSMLALPPQSPYRFTVQWIGADIGMAGLARVNVQIREGATGIWTDWQSSTTGSSAAYEGIGGHTYYFRARATDNAGNVEPWPTDYDAFTTVESLPPQTAVEPLPLYSHNGVLIRWGGGDPGDSGVKSYDVQYRQGAGTWSDWRLETIETAASFSGAVGETYSFRVRGKDKAQNLEAWPAIADATTTLYTWAIKGNVTDNRDAPVADVTVTTTPAALHAAPSGGDGSYIAYVADQAANFTANWSKATYGALPEMAFSSSTGDANWNVVLPPIDNVAQNWGFESGSLAPGWLAGGEISPALTSALAHTGRFSAVLAQTDRRLDPWVNLSNSAVTACGPTVAVDGRDVVHAAWWEVTTNSIPSYGELVYARREPGGGWSPPLRLYAAYANSLDMPQLIAEADGTVHLAWVGVSGYWHVLYSRRSPDGTWSGQVSLYSGFPRTLDMDLGRDRAVHLAWSTNEEILYTRRSPDGSWSEVTNISNTDDWSVNPQIAASPDGTAHVVWGDRTGEGYHILYTARASDGTWSAPLSLSNCPYWLAAASLEAASDGSIHAAWLDDSGSRPAIQYAWRSSKGAWSDPVQVSDNSAPASGIPQLALGPDGSVHLVWGGVVYARRDADGAWSDPEAIDEGNYYHMRVDSSGAAHIIWSKGPNMNEELYYARRTAGGVWSSSINVSNTPSTYSVDPQLALDGNDGVHVIWRDGPYGPLEILYAESANAQQTSDSILAQEMVVPTGVSAPTLSFWYTLDGVPTPRGAWLMAQVYDGATSTTVFTATHRTDWTHGWVDLTPWADQEVSLRFLVHQTEGKPAAWAALDEVTVGSAHPDAWIGLDSRGAAPPDAQFAQAITYGNRGGVTASNGRVTLQLPPDLFFISADPPPSATTPELRWDVGDLAAGSGPEAIHVTLQVAPTATYGTSLVTTAAITGDTTEVEQANNSAQTLTFVGYRVYLPLIRRE